MPDNKVSFFCKVSEKCKNKFDIALINNRQEHGTREEIIEKLFNFFSKNGMPTKK